MKPQTSADERRWYFSDIASGFVWAALLITVLLFSGGGSNFIYVDF